jgi:uncharacterized membrane protein YgdD (TMEM256/DUF423 family)
VQAVQAVQAGEDSRRHLNILVSVAGAFGFVGVALGAFGAHGLRGRLGPGGLEIWKTAVLYHLVHAVVLLALALAGERLRAARFVAVMFVIGVVIFSGSLYALALTGQGWLGAVTPFGGAAFLTGWLTLAVTGARR